MTNMSKWLEALRSGEYIQGRDRLRLGDRFCCLGVACDLYAKETGKGGWLSPESNDSQVFMVRGRDMKYTEGLPLVVSEWLVEGIKPNGGSVPWKTVEYDVGVELNDKGATFVEIANRVAAWVENQDEWVCDFVGDW